MRDAVDRIEAMIDDGDLIQSLHVAPLLKYLLKRRAAGPR